MSVDVGRRFSGETLATRAPSDAVIEALKELAVTDPRVVVLTSGQATECRLGPFADAHPDRFRNLGAAERNLLGVAAGMAAVGKVPFVVTSGAAATLGAAEILRTVARSGLQVIVVGLPSGVGSPAGAGRHSLEDLAVTMAIPGLRVVAPADAVQAVQAVRALLATPGPAYLRLTGDELPVFLDETTPFELGTALTLREGSDLTLIATGALTIEALKAADELEAAGGSARVIDVHTLKPLDGPAIRRAARDTGALVVAEEHHLRGGLGAAVAQEVVRSHPVPIEFIAVEDRLVSGGMAEELRTSLGLRAAAIVKAAERVRERKR